MPGTLTWDLTQETVVSARTEGLITHVQVKAPFTEVRRGQALATVQAPAWNAAIAEAHTLSQAQSASARELQGAAQQRLRSLCSFWRLGQKWRRAWRRPQWCRDRDPAREGQTVIPGTPLFKINGLDTLWLEASVPQAALGTLRLGTSVQATVNAWPAERFGGQIRALLPRSTWLVARSGRELLRNPQRRLVPGMFAEVLVQPDAEQALPVVPTEALIATGRDSRVIVQDPDGSFRPVRVSAGRSVQGRTQIVAGLAGGERVVVSGQFLLDSEANLSGALDRPALHNLQALPAHQVYTSAMTPGTTHALSCRHRPDSLRLSRQRPPPPRRHAARCSTGMTRWCRRSISTNRASHRSWICSWYLFGSAAAADCRASAVMSEAMEGTP